MKTGDWRREAGDWRLETWRCCAEGWRLETGGCRLEAWRWRLEVVVVPAGGKTVGGANGDVVVVFAASGRASEGEGRGGSGRGEGGVGVRTPLVVASCVAWRRARRAALSVASLSIASRS